MAKSVQAYVEGLVHSSYKNLGTSFTFEGQYFHLSDPEHTSRDASSHIYVYSVNKDRRLGPVFENPDRRILAVSL